MSNLTKRAAAPGDEGEIDLQLVPALPAAELHQLITHRGLDACAELVAAATAQQINAVLDLDLWRQTTPGRDRAFSVERFGEWIEMLVDADELTAARVVADMRSEVVIAGLARYVRVFDPGIFEPTAQSDDEGMDRHYAMREGDTMFVTGDRTGDRLECELGGYIIRSRRVGAWDAIVAVLIALELDHHDHFHLLMRGCRSLSNSNPEASGFDDLLMAPEQHLHDVTVEREQRLSRQGYVSPADARAFLEMARRQERADVASLANPIVAAYFRAADDASSTGSLIASSGDATEAAILARGRELAFLANVLVEGCSIQSRTFTAPEASDAAAAICKLGLECAGLDSTAIDHSLIAAFEDGWSHLHREVSLFSADRLIEILARLGRADRGLRLELAAFRRVLITHRETGQLWRARSSAEVLATLDPTAWVSVVGLLDECPIVPAAMTAILDGRTTTVSPTEFSFISTAAQIDNVRAFVRKLPDLLAL